MVKKGMSIVTALCLLLTLFSPVPILGDVTGAPAEVYAASAANNKAINKSVKLTQKGKKLTVKWGKVKKADGYIVYIGYRGQKYVKAATVKGNKTLTKSFTKISGKALDTSKQFMAYVTAYQLKKGKKTQIAKSKKVYANGSNYVESKPVKIKVFETSDVHGFLLDTSSGSDTTTYQYRLAYIANVINQARQLSDYDDVLLLDGGDIYQGASVSNLTKGDAVRAAFDIMKYDAVALGNHEFDWDVTKYAADKDATIPEYSIGSFKGDPDIPVLSSNLYDAKTGERVGFTKDYTIVKKAGKRIAVIGYADNFEKDVRADKIAPYKIDADISKFNKKVEEINKKEKPDVTIVLAHANPEVLAAGVDPEQVDLVAGGHEHKDRFGVATNGVTYIQPNQQSQSYAEAIIAIDKTGKVTIEDPKATGISGKDFRANLYDNADNADKLDADILKLSHEAWDIISPDVMVKLGYITHSVYKKTTLEDGVTTTGGNFVTRLMLEATKQKYGTVAAFFNRDGYRFDMVLDEGATQRDVTINDIYSLAPFCNFWRVYELTGAEIKQHIVNALGDSEMGDQVTGLTYEFTKTGTEEAPVYDVVSVTLDDGTKVDINDTTKTYRICTSQYNGDYSGSVFNGKTSIYSDGEAPVDNVTMIDLIREEAAAHGGLITVDTKARGKDVTAQTAAPKTTYNKVLKKVA